MEQFSPRKNINLVTRLMQEKRSISTYLSFIWPVITALYFPLGIYAANLTEIVREDVYRSLLIVGGMAVIVTMVFWLVFQDRILSVLVSIGSLLYFFTYGHLYIALKPISLWGLSLGRHRYLFPAATVILAVWVLWVWRETRARQYWYRFLRSTLIILILFPAYSMISGRNAMLTRPELTADSTRSIILEDSELYPDIYYIILDGYARADVLQSYYSFDNNDFLRGLRERGFYIADHATSNYDLTLLSLPSSLNMEYVNDLADLYSPNSGERRELKDRLRHSVVREVLEEEGYASIAFETGYAYTQIYDADMYLAPSGTRGVINSFEAMLLDTSLLRLLSDAEAQEIDHFEQKVFPEYEAHRVRVHFTLQRLGEIAALPERTFVFAHVVSPHPPFVFDSDGGSLIASQAFSFEDASSYHGTRDEYVSRYPGQMTYLNQLVLNAIDEIQNNSDHDAYILIQADHGPGSTLDWQNPNAQGLFERFSILNAYYFPGQDYRSLYSEITPVNSFRVLFNQLLDSGYTLLEDNQYFSPPENLLLFEEVSLP